jgi:hypothetical protein
MRTLELISAGTIKNALTSLSEKNIRVLLFGIILVCSVFYQIAKLGCEQAGYLIHFIPIPTVHTYKNPLDTYSLLNGRIMEGDIVMTDPLTAWLLPALTGAKIIALYHDNPLVPDNEQRVHDAITFYAVNTPLEARKALLEKYNATHVLLNNQRTVKNEINVINNYYQNFRIDPPLRDDLLIIGDSIFKNSDWLLIRLKPLHHQ